MLPIDFLRALQAEVAVISTGDNQKTTYKHPNCKTYQSLKDAWVALVLQTERGKTNCSGAPAIEPVVVNGTVRIDAIGTAYTISSYDSTAANGGTTLAFSQSCTLAGCSDEAAVASDCCRTCTNSQPCGDSCIASHLTCVQPPGCACAGQ